jgi:hypothetical protein
MIKSVSQIFPARRQPGFAGPLWNDFHLFTDPSAKTPSKRIWKLGLLFEPQALAA